MSTTRMFPALSELPDSFTLPLTQYGAIAISGEEQKKYLQGQVTCNVFEDNRPFLAGAQCDAKGKVTAFFHLLTFNESQVLIQPNSTLPSSLAQLQKYGVFAKVAIELLSDYQLTVLAGDNIVEQLTKSNIKVPETEQITWLADDAALMPFGAGIACYILLASAEFTEQLLAKLALPKLPEAVWSLLAITQGMPQIPATTINEFVPQMLNIQALKGISFTKGCYLGQETVARMQYLGKNKRAMYCVTGKAAAPEQLAPLLNNTDEPLIVELALGENWRKAGDVLHAYLAHDGSLYLQLVMTNDLEPNTQFRLQQQPETILHFNELPYSL